MNGQHQAFCTNNRGARASRTGKATARVWGKAAKEDQEPDTVTRHAVDGLEVLRQVNHAKQTAETDYSLSMGLWLQEWCEWMFMGAGNCVTRIEGGTCFILQLSSS